MMKDINDRDVQLGDIILIPLPGEPLVTKGFEQQICEKWTVVPALRDQEGKLIAYSDEMGYLLEV